MNEVFVVYYNESYMGGEQQRNRIDGVFASAEAARARIRELESMVHVDYADFESFVIES
jgi:hypothetical protein